MNITQHFGPVREWTKLDPNGYWVIIDGMACRDVERHDPTAKCSTQSYEPAFPLDPAIIRAVKLSIDAYNQALEDAAKIAEASCNECCERLAKDIRALKGNP